MFRDGGSSSVQLSWTNPDGTAGSGSADPGKVFRFDTQITSLGVVVPAGGAYTLTTNFRLVRGTS